jgi:hypothetical protein
MFGGELEWNVSLNPGAYATIFEIPCPIYWMPPCGVMMMTEGAVTCGEYGTNWDFKQKEVLPYLSERMQAYFAYVSSKECGTNWLSYLLDPGRKSTARELLDEGRSMCCTAGFLHVAGKTVTLDGQIVPLEAATEKAAYEFIPIEVRCNTDGITEWQKAQKPSSRYIFRVRDRDRYANAMVEALKSTLLELP